MLKSILRVIAVILIALGGVLIPCGGISIFYFPEGTIQYAEGLGYLALGYIFIKEAFSTIW